MVVLFSLLNHRISWASARMVGSLSHFRVSPSFAIHGAALPFPGTAIARVSPYFASAPVRIGLLPWSGTLLLPASSRPELVVLIVLGLFT